MKLMVLFHLLRDLLYYAAVYLDLYFSKFSKEIPKLISQTSAPPIKQFQLYFKMCSRLYKKKNENSDCCYHSTLNLNESC